MENTFETFIAKDKNFDLPFETRMVMYRFLSEIDKLAEEEDLNKKQLAEKTGVSASYITQLYRGNKILNLELIAKFQHLFDGVFDVKFKPRKSELLIRQTQDQITSTNVNTENGYGNTVFMNTNSLMYVVKENEESNVA